MRVFEDLRAEEHDFLGQGRDKRGAVCLPVAGPLQIKVAAEMVEPQETIQMQTWTGDARTHPRCQHYIFNVDDRQKALTKYSVA